MKQNQVAFKTPLFFHKQCPESKEKSQDTQGSKRYHPWPSETQWTEEDSWFILLLEPANQVSKCDNTGSSQVVFNTSCEKFCWEHRPLVCCDEKGTSPLPSSSQRHYPVQLLDKQVSAEGTLQNAWPAVCSESRSSRTKKVWETAAAKRSLRRHATKCNVMSCLGSWVRTQYGKRTSEVWIKHGFS